jgi:formate dehydrogenase subunit gamma
VRQWHPWVGVGFSAALFLMFLNWAGSMFLDADDRRWLRVAHRYAFHDETGVPETGRFNAGQKSLFWIQCLSGLLLLLSGIVLWLPESTSQDLRSVAIIVHPATAIFSMCGIIVHFYMATVATPGSLRGMIQGWVTPEWARAHHAKWYRKKIGE